MKNTTYEDAMKKYLRHKFQNSEKGADSTSIESTSEVKSDSR